MSNFKQLKDLLNDGSINLKVYIDRIVDLYRFEPKKKYIEELEDTDDSDSEIEDDSDESVASEEDEEIDTEVTTSRPSIHTEATTSRPFIRIGTQSDEVADDGKIPCDQCG
jgi:FtsZ-interacting cell division protein ZipA